MKGELETIVMRQEVLVLNNDYEPLNVCNLKRAIVMVYLGKAEILHSHEQNFASLSGMVDSPSVVKLRHHVKRPLPELKLSRRSIFARDHYMCQYCGYKSKELTLDHVIPKHKGGKSTWENLVCCCRKCNSKKGDKLPDQVNMLLTKEPRRPRYIPFISMAKYIEGARDENWRDYLPIFTDLTVPAEAMD